MTAHRRRRLLSRRPPPRHARRRSGPSPAAVAGVALFVATMAIATATNYTVPPVVASTETAEVSTTLVISPDGLTIPGPPTAATPTTVLTGAAAVPTTTAPPRVAPARLAIASIDVTTPLVQLGLNPDGTLEVPDDFRVAGWYAGGAAPGEAGPAIVAGHVDSYVGPGVFARLASVAVGAVVEVGRADGVTLRFRVTRVAQYPKAAFPTAEVYAPTAVPELRIVTCGGTFDERRKSYDDNVVVYAALETA